MSYLPLDIIKIRRYQKLPTNKYIRTPEQSTRTRYAQSIKRAYKTLHMAKSQICIRVPKATHRGNRNGDPDEIKKVNTMMGFSLNGA